MPYVFQDYTLDDQNYVLLRNGTPVKVEPKVFEVLVYLIRHRDRFVSREELFSQLWPDNVVSDAALNRCIAEARKAVGDSGVKQAVIRTQYTRGYRFIAEVEERVGGTACVQSAVDASDQSPSVAEQSIESKEGVPITIPQQAGVHGVPLDNQGLSFFSTSFRQRRWLQALCLVSGVLLAVEGFWGYQPVSFFHPLAFVSVEPGFIQQEQPVTGGEIAQQWLRHLKTSLDAYRQTQQGWEYYYRYTPEANALARQAFERAIALGPRVVKAHIGLGWTYWLEWSWLWSRDPQLLDKAQELAYTALRLQPTAPGAHALLAAVHLVKTHYEAALAAAKHAVELDGHHAGDIVILAEVLIYTGQPQVALTLLHEARERDPIGGVYAASIGHAYRVLGRYEEAVSALQQALTYNPNAASARLQLAVTYSQLDWDEKAWTEMQTALRNSPSFSADEVKRRIVYKEQAEFERFVNALEDVGIQ